MQLLGAQRPDLFLLKRFLIIQMKMAGFKKMSPRTNRPTPTIVRAPRASKISTDLQFYLPSYNFTKINRDLWFHGCNRTSSWAKYSPFLCSANLKIHHFELFSYELSNITSISLLSSKARVKVPFHGHLRLRLGNVNKFPFLSTCDFIQHHITLH